MKKLSIMVCGLAMLSLLADDAFGQRRQPQRRPAQRNVAPPPAPAPIVDTPPPAPPPVILADTIPLPVAPPGRRPSTTVDSAGVTVMDKIPLKYDQIRLDDQVYRQVIWRVIDAREKMNMAFMYEADEDNGNQRFLNILLKHIKEGDVTAFNAANDDRFTVPLTVAEVAKMLAGTTYEVDVPDYDKDPTGTLGITKRVQVRDEFDVNTIRSFAVKEEVIFDRETSRLHFRILGIAPIKTVFNSDGSERASYRLFWLYYPDLRRHLSRYDAYNARNMAQRMSWEEVFESRYFSSYIYKTTLNNPFDKQLDGIIKDPLMRLLEGERVKETIFNWEQDQWSY